MFDDDDFDSDPTLDQDAQCDACGGDFKVSELQQGDGESQWDFLCPSCADAHG